MRDIIKEFNNRSETMTEIEKLNAMNENVFTVKHLSEVLNVSDGSLYRLVFLFQVNAVIIGNRRIIITKPDIIAALKDFETDEFCFKNRAASMQTDVIRKVFGDEYYCMNIKKSEVEKETEDLYFETIELARKLKVSSRHILNIIEKRELKAERILRRFRVSMEALRIYLNKKQTFEK